MDGNELDWWAGHDWIRAAVLFAVFLLIAFVFDRWFAARGRRIAGRVLPGGITQQADTRLRFIRRLVSLVLLVIGFLIALSQFDGLGRVAGSFLASGALVAAIVGFAARQTLANLVAGIMLTISQPLRVGDWVTFEDNYGVVEDVRLNFTILRTLSEQRIVIPNERLVGGILRNDTLETSAVGLDVSLWLPPDADVPRAVEALREETGQTVSIAESAVEGTRLAVGGERVPPPERAKREAELREQCLRRLRADGVLST
ncbi:MAG TPA: mechanosensitive ion channel family protein [Solirubrobacteraceae bacterium]|jgi:small-conductance mechanosensitive channel|nr:mechanosensitive ion channel family protein [Solirubrobacteraceae bacterium]